jgi:hypothetical protein
LALAWLAIPLSAAPSKSQPNHQESKADWEFREACFGKWVRSDFLEALDTAQSPRSLERFSHAIHSLRMGPYTRCPYEVTVGPGTQCAEIDTGSIPNPEPYLVRWDAATGKGIIFHEAWELAPNSRSKGMTERHVGPDSVGWIRPGMSGSKPFLDVGFRKASVRMVPGGPLEQEIHRRFLSGSWTPIGNDPATPFTLFPNGNLKGFRLTWLFAMSPEQLADTTTYDGRSFALLGARHHGERMVVKNILRTPLCTLSWKRRQDTLRLTIFQKSAKRSRRSPWCDFVRTGDAPADTPEIREAQEEREYFDSLHQAAFLPATIHLDRDFKCLLDLEAAFLNAQEPPNRQARLRIAQSRAACVGSPTGQIADSGRVLWARDSTWVMESNGGGRFFTTTWRLKGPPRFRYMPWDRKDSAFRAAFRFIEPAEGPLWIPSHSNSRYRFTTENRHCSLNAGFGEWITLTSECADPADAKP